MLQVSPIGRSHSAEAEGLPRHVHQKEALFRRGRSWRPPDRGFHVWIVVIWNVAVSGAQTRWLPMPLLLLPRT